MLSISLGNKFHVQKNQRHSEESQHANTTEFYMHSGKSARVSGGCGLASLFIFLLFLLIFFSSNIYCVGLVALKERKKKKKKKIQCTLLINRLITHMTSLTDGWDDLHIFNYVSHNIIQVYTYINCH